MRPEEVIQQFLASSAQPLLLEPGEEPYPLEPGSFALDWHGTRLLFQVWDERRNLVRRVLGVEQERPGRLTLAVERFPRRTGTVELVDSARPAARAATRRSARHSFREEFRRYLGRQFPGWRIAELSTEPDLEHSLSPAYSRAFLKQGGLGWAAIGAPIGESSPAGALSFGLIWTDYLRRRERRVTVEGLALFLPAGRHRATALRLPWIHPRALKTALFLYSDDAQEELLDPRDYGNLDTRLDVPRPAAGTAGDKPEQILEARIRHNLGVVHPTLLDAPVYGQAPTFAAGERDVMDLLACDRYGRLAVVELKASADPHLPLQALDYWMRVRWHAARNEFAARGYFPGVPLAADPPRLFLVAPALEFHPTTETMLRFLAPEIEVERVGLAVEWKQRPRVVFRAQGAERPA
ncbi:MAG: hypothetical protein HY822_03865 [Acidobacteria bacterium]|nr:hypothetical protein [Acidobacteriota bacterium]